MNVWDKIHKLYYKQADWINKYNPSASELLKYVKNNSTVLDIGGGQGQDTEFFVSSGHDVTLLDGSKQAIEYAKKRLKNKDICFVKHDLNNKKLPFENDTFDAVYGHLSLHYFSKRKTREIFEEINRVLKKQSVVVIVCNTQKDKELEDEEIVQLEENFYQMSDGQEKRYFSVEDFRMFTKDLFDEKICDENANTYKDGDKGLVRFIGKKI